MKFLQSKGNQKKNPQNYYNSKDFISLELLGGLEPPTC